MAETVVLANQNNMGHMLRQLGLLVGIAASVALGVYVVLWSQTPNYEVLFGNLNDKDAAAVQALLSSTDIPFKVDNTTGAVMVAGSAVHEARMKLATEGLPRSSSIGFELLDEEQGFGTSQFMEKARYQRALAGELARSISSLSNVRNARVQIAIPRQSVFARERKSPTASVLVELYSGRQLEAGQITAITHMVASSIPEMKMSDVSVVDQRGNLLSARGGSDEMALTGKRFEYTRQLEKSYIDRIENILTPIVGHDGVRASVTAEVDFTRTETATESYNPDQPAMRSEQMMEEQRAGAGPGGVPGALSNQPPAGGTAPETTADGTATGAAANDAQNLRKQSTRNFELDKTISHTHNSVGSLRRLSVAVVVDDRKEFNEDGTITRVPKTPEEIDQLKTLVREAIGFSAARGDTVNVINAGFTLPQAPEELPEIPVWKQSWAWDIAKQVLGGVFVLFLALGVLRPVLRNMLKSPELRAQQSDGSQALPAGESPGQAALPPATSRGMSANARLKPSSDYASDLGEIKQFVAEDPRLAAQVVKKWVGTE